MTPAAFYFRDDRGRLRVALWSFRALPYVERYEPRGRYVCDLTLDDLQNAGDRAIRRNRRRCSNQLRSSFARRAGRIARTLAILAVRR